MRRAAPIVGLKTHDHDHKSLSILFVELKTQCYTQHQTYIQNILQHLRRSFCENVDG